MKFDIIVVVLTIVRSITSSSDTEQQNDEFLTNLKNDIRKVLMNQSLPENTFLTISQLLHKFEYPFESHQVPTEDGFVLTLHRIPSIKQESPPVLLVPPLLCSSVDYVNRGPNISLGLLLHDLDYDVWLINTRGTRYSMTHTKFNSSQEEFWDFSFHEKGYYDLAASIDFILHSTTSQKLTLVGFSEGTSASMSLLTTRPDYNDRINLLVLLSPIGYVGGVSSPIPLLLTRYLREIEIVSKIINLHGLPYTEWISELLVLLCNHEELRGLCSTMFGLFTGFDPEQQDMDYMVVFVSDKPSGVSLKQLIHYGQEILSATFRQFDYGAAENLIRYRSKDPPAYEIEKITAPVAAYYGQNDYFASTSDVEKLVNQMPNVADLYLVEHELFNHLDFISARDVKSLLYDRVIGVIEKYNKT